MDDEARLKTAKEKAAKIKDTLYKSAAFSLRLMPLWMEAIGAGALIASVMQANPNLKERLKELDNKLFLFEVKDIGKSFYMRIKDGDVSIVPHVLKTPDATMKGDARVLMDVFLGKVDPDTVFFSRRLEVSGDTAVAIHLKNILASIW
jgi:predicted lipid carrier protein YhbT